jgi:hypothetical protein
MRKLLLIIVALGCLVFAASAQATVLLGDQNIEPTIDGWPSPNSEAFGYTAISSGTAGSISVYLDSKGGITVGLYANSSTNRPDRRLAVASNTSNVAHAWATIPIPAVTINSGTRYWIAVGGNGGSIAYRQRYGWSYDYRGTGFASPYVWTTQRHVQLSAYVSSTTARPVKPADTVLPGITGTPQQGQTLTASPGTWTGTAPISYSYVWSDGTTGSTDTFSAGDIGQNISVTVTATNSAGSTQATSANVGPVTAANPPVNTILPVVPGTAQQGATLTASTGTWTNNPSLYTYQWQDDGTRNIAGATNSSYTAQLADVGHTLDVVVTASNVGGSGQATSAQTGTVQSAPVSPPVNTALPVVSGTAQRGQTLSTTNGSWSGNPTSYSYQWQDCTSSTSCTDISGATGSSYTLQASDVGDTVDVVVTATNAGGSGSATSAQTAVVTSTGAGSHQMFANYLAWATDLGSNLPWKDMTQVVMFALKTTNGTALDASTNVVNHYNLPSWTAMVHSHSEQAFIAIGGSNDADWQDACDSTNQAGFVSNLVNYIVSNGFDGVDLDIEDSGNLSASQLEGCVRAIATAARAATTGAGKTPIVAEEMDESLYNSMPYSTIQYDISYLDQVQLEYFGYNPYSDWNCGTGSPANNCAYVTQMVGHATSQGIPADKLLLGMATYSPYAQGSYSTLTTTTSAVDTTSGTPSSIPVSSISSTINPGDIVLASTENPPTHYEVFTTSGAAACSSNCSIPITGIVHGSGGYTFPAGSVVQSAYAGPWDCYNMGQYATTHGLEGNMIFDLQDDQASHNGSFACSDQIGLGLGS